MEEAPAKADPNSATAAAPAADTTTSQPDTSNLTLEEIDTLFEKGEVEVPVVGAAAKGEEATLPETEPAKKPAEKLPEGAIVEGEEAGKEVVEEEPPAGKVEDPPPVKPEDEVERIQRPRLKNPVDQQIAAVFKAAETGGTPISWAEAERRVKGDPAPPPEKKEPVQVAPNLSETVATLTDEIAAMDTRLDEIGEAEGLITPEYVKLQRERGDKVADLKLATRDLAQAEKDALAQSAKIKTESDTAREKARATATERWPDAADDATPLGKAVAERIAAMKNPNHPDHAILYADSAPLTIVREVADELGIAPKTAPAKPAAATPPTTRKVVSPVPGNKTSVPPVKPAEDAATTLDYARSEASLAELDEAFGAGDKTRTLAAVAGR